VGDQLWRALHREETRELARRERFALVDPLRTDGSDRRGAKSDRAANDGAPENDGFLVDAPLGDHPD
jgi:hypothetical protein